MGGEHRGFDGDKKVPGRKRHVPVNTEGLAVEAGVHGAEVPDRDGVGRLLEPAKGLLPCLPYPRACGLPRTRQKQWAEEALGEEAEVVDRVPKPPPGKSPRIRAREWFENGRELDLKKLPERPAFEKLPPGWVAERAFAGTSHGRGMGKDHGGSSARRARPPSGGESRPMVRRRARA